MEQIHLAVWDAATASILSQQEQEQKLKAGPQPISGPRPLICIVEGCGESGRTTSASSGFCSRHSYEFRKHGNIVPGRLKREHR